MNEKILINFQQAELNAVVLYKGLAERIKNNEDKDLLLSIAADEGRHAAILKQYTKKQLTPKSTLKNAVVFMYKIIGKKALFSVMAKFEKSAGKLYEPYFEEYPEIKTIAADEIRHGKMLLGM